MSVKEVAETFIEAQKEAWNKGNFDKLEKIETPDVSIHFFTLIPDIVGFEAHKQYITTTRQNNSVRQEWEYIIGDGNVCVLSLKETVKLGVESPALSLPAGSTIVIDALFVLRIDNNKVAEGWVKASVTPQ